MTVQHNVQVVKDLSAQLAGVTSIEGAKARNAIKGGQIPLQPSEEETRLAFTRPTLGFAA